MLKKNVQEEQNSVTGYGYASLAYAQSGPSNKARAPIK